MPASVQLSFIVGWIAMLAGGVAFWAMSRSLPMSEKRHGVAAMSIVFVAFANYFAMAIGQGDIMVHGKTVFIARYTDWVITTPILLASLAMMATPDLSRVRTLIGALIVADIYMILTGLVGNLSVAPNNYYWWGISMVAFLAVLGMIWGPLRTEANQGHTAGEYSKLAMMLTVLWIGYPIVWLIGSSGFDWITLTVESWLYLVLDVTAKVGFGFVALAAARHVRH
ncbi:bacteriorhodopsin [Salinicola aestuarinus]|uniref:bacteriorhodopsin n=1 Tax=Salinicola aestuarinus TaxID=1949082 RepID=UPI000DA22106|nr:bacteriorhodopsin [Salinicola aestuarinus]